ncbi:unnamed protein product, partial [Laminaria digitata]
ARVAELVRKRQVGGAPLLLGSSLTTDLDSSTPPTTAAARGAGAGAGRRVLCDSKGSVAVPDGEGRMRAEGVAGGEGAVGTGAVVGVECGLEHDPEEELAVLDQLIEWQRQTGEYGDAAKERFDALVGKIGDLEKEKLTLIDTMKSASTQNGSSKDGGKGGSKGGSSADALRERLKGVESQLASLGAQKKKQERAVMLLQRESKKCEDLQEGLGQLKRQKVVLQKRQQEAAKRHREYEQKMSREIQAMRKKSNKDLRHMSKMELEVRRQKAATARKTTQV